MDKSSSVGPLTARERLHEVDVVRGFAILGILLVNMPLFFSPVYLEFLGKMWFEDGVNVGTELGILAFAQGKFYTIFSILFGFGLAIQYERFRVREMSFPRFWIRRMLVLLTFGLVHAWLIWFGDILTWYALVSMPLLLFRNAKPKTLLIWAVILLLVPLFLMAGFTGLFTLLDLVPEAAEQVQVAMEQQRETILENLNQAAERYPVAGYAEIVTLNMRQWTQIASSVFFLVPNLLGMFTIGLLFARRRLFHDSETLAPKFRKALLGLLPVAILANGSLVFIYPKIDMLIPNPGSFGYMVILNIGQISGCMSYILLILLAYHSRRLHRLVAPVSAVGRMALTNYLTHSIVFTTLANGYGFGLYGRVSPSVGLLMTLAIFVIQIGVSNAWLKHFRFGPMEWLWRSLTYGRLQPMRRAG